MGLESFGLFLNCTHHFKLNNATFQVIVYKKIGEEHTTVRGNPTVRENKIILQLISVYRVTMGNQKLVRYSERR